MRVFALAQVADTVTAEPGAPEPEVYGQAVVTGQVVLPVGARIKGAASISSQADLLVLGPGPSGAYTTAHRDTLLGVRVTRGCYSGNLAGFEEMIDTYAALSDESRAAAREYAAQIRTHFELD